jgi:hypothetical protein
VIIFLFISALGANYFNGDDVSLLWLAINGIFLIALFVLGTSDLIIRLWCWRSDINPDIVAGFSLSNAIREYRTGDVYDPDEVMKYLREMKEFLKIGKNHKYISPSHASSLSDYIERLEDATDRNSSIEKSFPPVSRFAASVFSPPSGSPIEEQIAGIDTTPTPPGTIQALVTDLEELVKFLFTGRIGALSIASLVGIPVGFYFGFQLGLTVFFGVAALYSTWQK